MTPSAAFLACSDNLVSSAAVTFTCNSTKSSTSFVDFILHPFCSITGMTPQRGFSHYKLVCAKVSAIWTFIMITNLSTCCFNIMVSGFSMTYDNLSQWLNPKFELASNTSTKSFTHGMQYAFNLLSITSTAVMNSILDLVRYP